MVTRSKEQVELDRDSSSHWSSLSLLEVDSSWPCNVYPEVPQALYPERLIS